MNKNGNKKNIWLICAIVLFIIALICGVIWISQYLEKRNAQKDRDSLMSSVNAVTGNSNSGVLDNSTTESTPDETEPPTEPVRTWADYTLEEKYQAYFDTYGITVPRKNLDFEELRASVNSDIYAWIYVPGTNVDDPVVQHPSDDSHYLDYNLNGKKGYPGGIYTERCNSKDFSDRMTVIYGHNMKTGTAFGSLHNFEDKKVFNENRYIFIYLPDDIMVYEIFACYEWGSTHLIKGFNWDDDTWVQYLNYTLGFSGKNDNHLESHDFNEDDLVLTLSTCLRNAPNGRYLVQGVLLNEVR